MFRLARGLSNHRKLGAAIGRPIRCGFEMPELDWDFTRRSLGVILDGRDGRCRVTVAW